MINKKESIELKIFKELSKFNLQTYHTIDNMPRLLKNEFTLFIHFFYHNRRKCKPIMLKRGKHAHVHVNVEYNLYKYKYFPLLISRMFLCSRARR